MRAATDQKAQLFPAFVATLPDFALAVPTNAISARPLHTLGRLAKIQGF
jgi:hypothetical protein